MFLEQIPVQVRTVLRALEGAGYSAYVVGGCVRDTLMARDPADWDVATSAQPEQVKAVMGAYRVADTGLRHGTVTAIIDGMPIEITTFREEGEYLDLRHPSSVSFTADLQADLARRDFTVNAMAWSEKTGLVDPFDGAADLTRGILRAVGEPRKRFSEDALRILRALRFASVLSFSLEEATSAAVLQCRRMLSGIAAERIASEFLRLLCGKDAVRVLREYRPVFEVFLPEIAPMAGLDQRSPYHQYDVWEHTLHALAYAGADPELRLAVLLHDIGKPQCRSIDRTGRGHFRGHQETGAAVAEQVCRRLRLSRSMTANVTALVRFHDISVVCGEANVRRWLNRLGLPLYRKLLELNRADTLAHAAPAFRRLPILDQAEADLERILQEGQCWTLGQLAVGGSDLAGLACGPALGNLLRRLLDAVIDGSCPNERGALLELAARLCREEA